MARRARGHRTHNTRRGFGQNETSPQLAQPRLNVKFQDQVKIWVRSGDGGAGCVSFRREKYIPRGKPDGGNGGRGGDIGFIAAHRSGTLIDFRYRQHFRAGKGHHGMGRMRTGASAPPLDIEVPVGTQILSEDKKLLYDLNLEGHRVTFLQGGRGGLGNASMKSGTHRSPTNAQPGEEGQAMWLWLCLKLIADLGIVGLPNAGKSSLLATLTRAAPKVGAYPFTTTWPHLGVLARGRDTITLADLPGLIDGAHTGKGMGIRFLSHAERCRALVHLVSAEHDDWWAAYTTIRTELEAYESDVSQETDGVRPAMAHKPELVVLSKCDLLTPERRQEQMAEMSVRLHTPVLGVSSMSHEGLDVLERALWQHTSLQPRPEPSGSRPWSPCP